MIALRRKLFWVLSLCAIFLVASYAFFIQTSVVHRMAYDSWLGKSSSLELASQKLESKYYQLTEAITMPVASAMGFVNASGIRYLDRSSSLSLVNYDASPEGR